MSLSMKALLRVPGFILKFRTFGKDTFNVVSVSNFSKYLYQIISRLLGRPHSGRKGKHAADLVTWWDLRIYCWPIDLDLLIDRHVIPLFPRNCSVDIGWNFILYLLFYWLLCFLLNRLLRLLMAGWLHLLLDGWLHLLLDELCMLYGLLKCLCGRPCCGWTGNT